MKRIYMVLAFLSAACSDEKEEKLFSDNIIIKNVIDVGNNENASDIRIDFVLTKTDIGDFWILVIKESSFPMMDLAAIQSLTDNNYTVLTSSNDVAYSVKLSELQVDTDGDPIQNREKYVLSIFTTGDQKLSMPSEVFELKNESVLNGEYTGTWDDNIYTSFGISARITGSLNSYGGEFFYTGNFTSCCGGNDDGRISFTVEDHGTITKFRYNQDLINFMGGCPGLYTGSGSITNIFTLNIDFEGDDCEGPHTGGKIVLTKRF